MRGRHKQSAARRRAGVEEQRLADEAREAARVQAEIDEVERQADDLSAVAAGVYDRLSFLQRRDAEEAEKLRAEAARLAADARFMEERNELTRRELKSLAQEVVREIEIVNSLDSVGDSRVQSNELFHVEAIDAVCALTNLHGARGKNRAFMDWQTSLRGRQRPFEYFLTEADRRRPALLRQGAPSEGYMYGNTLASLRPELAESYRSEHPVEDIDAYVDAHLDEFLQWVRANW